MLVLTSCEKERTEISGGEESTPSLLFDEIDIAGATKVIALNHALLYKLQAVNPEQLLQTVTADGMVDDKKLGEALKPEYGNDPKEFMMELQTYLYLKDRLREKLATEGKLSNLDQLFDLAAASYSTQVSSGKSDEACLDDLNTCIAQAVADGVADSYNCSGSSDLRACLYSDDPSTCDGNGLAILFFSNCELSVFSTFLDAYSDCEVAYEDCCDDDEPTIIIPEGGVPPLNPGGGSGGTPSCNFSVVCGSCNSAWERYDCEFRCTPC